MPVVVVSGLVVRAHLRASRGGGRALPGPLWVPVIWCFVAALAVGSWGGACVGLLVYVGAGAIDTRGAELFFLDLSSVIALVGAGSLIGTVGVGYVALAVRRRERWGAAWPCPCAPSSVQPRTRSRALGRPLLMFSRAPCRPLPVLVGRRGPLRRLRGWFSASEGGRPLTASERPSPSEPPSLTDRWFT